VRVVIEIPTHPKPPKVTFNAIKHAFLAKGVTLSTTQEET
jgi:hypothetical protein